jgi:GNAT superfamily N-acetyltransferase
MRRDRGSDGLVLVEVPDGGRRYELLYECLDLHELSEPVWTLHIVTVEPDVQRRGIASAFFEHGLGLARRSACARSSTRVDRSWLVTPLGLARDGQRG